MTKELFDKLMDAYDRDSNLEVYFILTDDLELDPKQFIDTSEFDITLDINELYAVAKQEIDKYRGEHE